MAASLADLHVTQRAGLAWLEISTGLERYPFTLAGIEPEQRTTPPGFCAPAFSRCSGQEMFHGCEEKGAELATLLVKAGRDNLAPTGCAKNSCVRSCASGTSCPWRRMKRVAANMSGTTSPERHPLRILQRTRPSISFPKPHFSAAVESEPGFFSRAPLPACSTARQRLLCRRFWEGGGSLPARAGGGKSEHRRVRCRVTPFFGAEIHAGDGTGRFLDGKCHRK
jgi:hypothetical protein